jgi:hypothetical protein
MQSRQLRTLCIPEFRALVRAADQSNLSALENLLQSQKKGKDGAVELFSCPRCYSGFLELMLDIILKWQGEKEMQERGETWLVYSQPLRPDDVRRLHALDPVIAEAGSRNKRRKKR